LQTAPEIVSDLRPLWRALARRALPGPSAPSSHRRCLQTSADVRPGTPHQSGLEGELVLGHLHLVALLEAVGELDPARFVAVGSVSETTAVVLRYQLGWGPRRLDEQRCPPRRLSRSSRNTSASGAAGRCLMRSPVDREALPTPVRPTGRDHERRTVCRWDLLGDLIRLRLLRNRRGLVAAGIEVTREDSDEVRGFPLFPSLSRLVDPIVR